MQTYFHASLNTSRQVLIFCDFFFNKCTWKSQEYRNIENYLYMLTWREFFGILKHIVTTKRCQRHRTSKCHLSSSGKRTAGVMCYKSYPQTSNISHTSVGNKIVDHSDVVGASPVGAAPTTSSSLTQHLASMDWANKTARRDEEQWVNNIHSLD